MCGRRVITRNTQHKKVGKGADISRIEAGRLCGTGWTNGVVFGPASGVGKQVGGFARGFHPFLGCGSLLALVFWQP